MKTRLTLSCAAMISMLALSFNAHAEENDAGGRARGILSAGQALALRLADGQRLQHRILSAGVQGLIEGLRSRLGAAETLNRVEPVSAVEVADRVIAARAHQMREAARASASPNQQAARHFVGSSNDLRCEQSTTDRPIVRLFREQPLLSRSARSAACQAQSGSTPRDRAGQNKGQ